MATPLPKSHNYFQRTYTPRDILLLAFVVTLVNAVINYLYPPMNVHGLPFNTFLCCPEDRFGDFFKVIDALRVVETWEAPNPYDTFAFYEYILPYSATLYFVLAKLIGWTGNQYVVFAGFFLLLIIAVTIMARRRGNDWLTILFVVLSYPMIFAFDRGNFALVVFVFLLLALTTESLLVSMMAIAMAASIKLTPFIFLLPVLVSRGQVVRGLLYLAGCLLLINFASIQINGHFLTPSVYDPQVLFLSPLSAYSQIAVTGLAGLAFGNSLYMPALYLAMKFSPEGLFITYVKPIHLPLLIFTLIGIVVLVKNKFAGTLEKYWRAEKMIFVICISLVLFMPVTADYYLLIMIIPLIFFPGMNYSFGYFIAYGFLLGAKNFFSLEEETFISLQTIINPLLLLAMLLGEFEILSSIKRDGSGLMAGKYVGLTGMGVVLAVLAGSYYINHSLVKQRQETLNTNLQEGLPSDFDPQRYLDLNPDLQEYWKSIGIEETGESLMIRAKQHYISFGKNQGKRYK